MKYVQIFMAVLLIVGVTACASKPKAKPLVPLMLTTGSTPQALTLTQQGTTAYQSGQFAEAKTAFARAVASAPESGHAHYNLAIALNKLGEAEEAHKHFIEAANLSPGDKEIWDSPALRQFGNPETSKPVKEHPMTTSRPTIGSGPR
jgi:Flp pilus assembly protein TadD